MTSRSWALFCFPLLAVAAAIALHPAKPAAPAAADRDALLASAPVASAYAELAAAEARHQQRFRDAVDPAGTRGRLDRAAASATGDALAAAGLELFTFDFPAARERRPLVDSTRCASCHHQGAPGGAGGLVDGDRDGLNPPALFGAGLLERLAAEIDAELARAHAAGKPPAAKGISFPAGSLPPDGHVRPFGRRAEWATVDEAVSAMAGNTLASDLSPAERGAIAVWIRALPAPGFEPPDAATTPDLFARFESGRARFVDAGCAACHVPSLPLADGTRVAAFTDLKLHDLGADGRWLTPPLWGLAASAPYLHDGRAMASLDDAVSAHGGEGETARKAYWGLDPMARGEIRVYLLSMSPHPRIQVVGR